MCLKKKGTILKLSEYKEHLFVILTNECPEKNHLLVNFSSIHPNVFHDDACVVNAGEHPFIKRPSYIEYRRAGTVKASHLIKCDFTQKEDVSDELYTRICNGLMLSIHTPKRKKILQRKQIELPHQLTPIHDLLRVSRRPLPFLYGVPLPSNPLERVPLHLHRKRFCRLPCLPFKAWINSPGNHVPGLLPQLPSLIKTYVGIDTKRDEPRFSIKPIDNGMICFGMGILFLNVDAVANNCAYEYTQKQRIITNNTEQ